MVRRDAARDGRRADRPLQVAERALEIAGPGARILLVGAAYKPGVADARCSPACQIAQRLTERGADVAYYDPLVEDAEQRLRSREEQARQDEGVVRQKLAAVEQELEGLRTQRRARAKDLPAALLASYDRISKARGGVAIAAVTSAAVCGGCRVDIRPQAVQELRSATGLMVCESCGRYLYWHE